MLVVLLISVIPSTILYYVLPKPRTIEFHLRKMNGAYSKFFDPDLDLDDPVTSEWLWEAEKQRDILADLGHFRKCFIPIVELEVGSEQWDLYRQALNRLNSERPMYQKCWLDDGDLMGLMIWVLPENYPDWITALAPFTTNPQEGELSEEYQMYRCDLDDLP